MQIKFRKILERDFLYNESQRTIPKDKIMGILIDATRKSNTYIQANLDEYLEGKALLEFNKLLKILKKAK